MKIFTYTGIAALVALAWIVGSKRMEITVSEDYGVKNAALQRECDSLRIIINTLQTDTNVQHAAADSMQRIIYENSEKIKEIKGKYEKDIDSINRMPADSLYLFFAGYIAGQ